MAHSTDSVLALGESLAKPFDLRLVPFSFDLYLRLCVLRLALKVAFCTFAVLDHKLRLLQQVFQASALFNMDDFQVLFLFFGGFSSFAKLFLQTPQLVICKTIRFIESLLKSRVVLAALLQSFLQILSAI